MRFAKTAAMISIVETRERALSAQARVVGGNFQPGFHQSGPGLEAGR